MANDSLYVTLGDKICQLRKDKKLTIAQLAELADIDDYYLGEIITCVLIIFIVSLNCTI